MADTIDVGANINKMTESLLIGGPEGFANTLSHQSTVLSQTEFRDALLAVQKNANSNFYLTDIEVEMDGDQVNKVYLDKSKDPEHAGDQLVWDRAKNAPQPAGSQPLEDEAMERYAQKLAGRLTETWNSEYNGSVVNAERAGADIRDAALSIPDDQQYAFLNRIAFLNQEARNEDAWIPALRLTFGDTNGDGRRTDLSDMKLTMMLNETGSRHFELDTVDLYDP